MMKTRPIIFNGKMVSAILNGRKMQTRRVIEGKSLRVIDRWVERGHGNGWYGYHGRVIATNRKCPYGIPGDCLWVRETWFPMQDIKACAVEGEPIDIVFKADWDADGISRNEARDVGVNRWRSPIFMPRWASRITLKVIGVRVEQVQDISEEDAKHEGITGVAYRDSSTKTSGMIYPAFPDKDGGFPRASQAFEALWDSINAKRGYGWVVNPWVWCISFKVLS